MDHNNFLATDSGKIFLNYIQKNFPIDSRPFLKIAQKFGLEEEEVIDIIQKLHKENIIRQISAIFNPHYFGHKSCLFAFKVPENKIDEVASIINRHPGVSHNYLRNHIYNLWFILVSLPQEDPLEEAKKLASFCKIDDYLYLPAIRVFKISTIFGEKNLDLERDDNIEIQEDTSIKNDFTEIDKFLVKSLQEPLPLVKSPFKQIAKDLNIDEEFIFLWLKQMQQKGALRRFGALLKHTKIGFKSNIMVAWKVEKNRIENLVKILSQKLIITHCYERKTYPDWQYNFYTMCHFKEKENKNKIYSVAKEIGVKNFILLETIKEFKKIRLKLFYDKRNF